MVELLRANESVDKTDASATKPSNWLELTPAGGL